MKELLRQYGAAIIAGTVLLFLTGLLGMVTFSGQRGLLDAAGSGMAQSIALSDPGDNEAFDAYMQLPAPTMSLAREYLTAGETVELGDLIDTENAAAVRLLALQNEAGEQVSTAGERSLCLQQPGLYRLTAEAQNALGRKTRAEYIILVNPAEP